MPQGLISIALLVIGVILLIMGAKEADSIASSFSKFFTGNPTDRAVWLMIGGVLALVLGAVLGGVSLKARNA